jgi:transcriptional regulator of acetoin/glycerol metabolism
MAMSDGPLIQIGDLSPELRAGIPASPQGVLSQMQIAERDAIARALASVEGHRVEAANLLGIGKTTLYRKLKEYGL